MMIETNCVLCGELVYASPKPETWGIDWRTGHVHYKCANDLFEAIKRMEEISEYPKELKKYFLTNRQMEVLQLIADGNDGKEISIKLCITVGTVKNHRVDIYNKLGAKSAAHAVAIGFRKGIIM